jgi:hypothetical protein
MAQDALHLGGVLEGISFAMEGNLQLAIVLAFAQPVFECPADGIGRLLPCAP